MIVAEANAQGVDPNLALAVAEQESGLNQSARGAAGEIGVFQLAPATAAALGVNPSDLASNIRGGIAYLRAQLSAFGNVAQALAAYNWGPPRMAAIARLADWFARIPASTQAYVTRILASVGLPAPAVPAQTATPPPPSSTAQASPADLAPAAAPFDLASFFAPADTSGDTGTVGTPGTLPAFALAGAAVLLLVLLWN